MFVFLNFILGFKHKSSSNDCLAKDRLTKLTIRNKLQTRTRSLLGGGREETQRIWGRRSRGAQRVMGRTNPFRAPKSDWVRVWTNCLRMFRWQQTFMILIFRRWLPSGTMYPPRAARTAELFWFHHLLSSCCSWTCRWFLFLDPLQSSVKIGNRRDINCVYTANNKLNVLTLGCLEQKKLHKHLRKDQSDPSLGLCLDYCNSLLYGTTACHLNKIRRV